MTLDEFDYHLPPQLIAQAPAEPRDQSRLLVVNRADGRLEHAVFAELPKWLRAGDLLILNDTRVLPARLLGQRSATGGRWEGLYLRSRADGVWEVLGHCRGRLLPGETINLDGVDLSLTLREKTAAGHWLVEPSEPGSPAELLAKCGRLPLPPYINEGIAGAADGERYQTVYARRAGAVAAPTAGLHFTPQLLERLRSSGIEHRFVTLHVGAGTFQPIRETAVEAHHMHAEWGELSAETATAIQDCKARGNRVVTVGTTGVRVLESAAAVGAIGAWSGDTELYIYPPYRFKTIDALITNFHLPRTSLLVLVSAFAGIELTRTAYRHAIENAYRFYSYGDAMLIV